MLKSRPFNYYNSLDLKKFHYSMIFMLNYNDLSRAPFMVYEGQPYVVMEFHFKDAAA